MVGPGGREFLELTIRLVLSPSAVESGESGCQFSDDGGVFNW